MNFQFFKNSWPQISFLGFGAFLLLSGFWVVDLWVSVDDLQMAIWVVLVTWALLSINFLFMFFSEGRTPDWRWGACLGFLLTIATPSTLQTDQLRYVWDGWMTWQGINPYRFAPVEAPYYHQIFWAQYINHSHLSTLYPPFAQVLFALAALLNPFFWPEIFGWGPFGGPEGFWQAELGWKILTGIGVASFIYFLRYRKWWWILAHPLFLHTVCGNAHIDFFYCWVLVILGLSRTWKGTSLKVAAVAMSAIFIKWTPLILAPAILLRAIKKWNWSEALSTVFLVFGFFGGLTFLYYAGSKGQFFEGLAAYGREWFFFGYFHRLLVDLTSPRLGMQQAVGMAKAIGLIIFVILWGGLFWNFYQKKIRLELFMPVAYFLFLAFSPTIHPWYLLPVLILGIRYLKKIWVFWIWPLLAPLSITYSLRSSDPTSVRYFVYGIVSVFLVLAIRRMIWRTPQMRSLGYKE